METYSIVEAAERCSLPWLALRAVVDPADETLPAPLRSWRSDRDERAIALALARRPDTWPAVARLALQMNRATGALTRSVPLAIAAATALPAAASPR
jgi:hypothetical protein